MTDPIADMLTRIRNAARVKKPTVVIPYSRMKKALADILAKEGYVSSIAVEGTAPFSTLVISLKYNADRIAAIHALKRVSKPGSRTYIKNEQIPAVLNNFGVMILSTSKGLMTNRDARKEKVGGEIVCEIH